MQKKYKRTGNGFYLILEGQQLYKEDYQIRMILENEIAGLLKMQGRGVDENSCFFYDIGGKHSLKKKYMRGTVSRETIVAFLSQFTDILEELYQYMLNVNCLLLRPEFIFQENDEFYFCYYPCGKRDLSKEFHKFTEYLVSQIDYEDTGSIKLAYELHKRTMESQYDIRKLIMEITEKQELNKKKKEKIIDFNKIELPEKQMICGEAQEERYVYSPNGKRKKEKWGSWGAFTSGRKTGEAK